MYRLHFATQARIWAERAAEGKLQRSELRTRAYEQKEIDSMRQSFNKITDIASCNEMKKVVRMYSAMSIVE